MLALVLLGEAPALAGPCRTAGSAESSIAFPKNEPGDVPFARSMASVMLPNTTRDVPDSLSCTRRAVHTAQGDYLLGGENGEPFPRMALPADGKGDRLVYVAPSPAAPATFALVVLHRDSTAVVTRFYAGVPTDALLAADIPAALADDEGIMRYDADRNMVLYAFTPAGGVPPPVMSGRQADGSEVTAGPQIGIATEGDSSTLDIEGGLMHKPSGFACPQTFPQLAASLKSIDPRKNSLACSYRAGTDPTYREDDPVRYQLVLERVRRGETARSEFDRLAADGRKNLRIKGDHAAPLAVGRSPLPEFVLYWDIEGGGVQGLWVAKMGGWIVWVHAQYAADPANDLEAGKIAQTLFAGVAKAVK
jgi:hypothetical protein